MFSFLLQFEIDGERQCGSETPCQLVHRQDDDDAVRENETFWKPVRYVRWWSDRSDRSMSVILGSGIDPIPETALDSGLWTLDSGLWTLDSAGALFFVFLKKFRFTVLKLLYRSRPFYSYASSRFHTKKFKFYAAAKHSASASRTDSSTVHQFSIFFKEWAVSCAALLHVMQSNIT